MTATVEAVGDGATGVEQIIAEFRSALRELKCVGSERMLRGGLSMGHWHIMAMLDRHGDMTMSGLADLLDVSLSNGTGIVDRMEERGLVERLRVPDDRRIVRIRLTDRGRQMLTEMDVLRDDFLRKVLQKLPPAKLGRLVAAVGDLRTAIAEVALEEPGSIFYEHAHGRHTPAAVARA